ncbi:MAG: metal-binding protein [Acidobacteria bacterium]|nr:metal-binding protein [Acidobacteriota bacterium]
MPSAKTHDFITFALAVPTALVSYYFTGNWTLTLITTVAMLFGGLMFGPDLDIQSKQYTRWGPLRFIWWPYKVALSHRSRFSHGIVFGTLIRIAYFLIVVSLLLAIVLFAREKYLHHRVNGVSEVQDAFTYIWEILKPIKRNYLIAAFAGLWLGAASHTASDVLGSFFKSVKRSF